MKKYILIGLVFIITAVSIYYYSFNGDSKPLLKVGTEALYPPFEYVENGKIIGFDIDLTNEIAKRINKEVKFVDMQFTAVMPSLDTNKINVGVAAITITAERKENFDFSIPYAYGAMAINYREDDNLTTKDALKDKKVCVQLGSTMEIWGNENLKDSKLVSMDSANQCIQSLKTNQVDAVIIDNAQASVYASNNAGLKAISLEISKEGYGFVFKKGSPLKQEFDTAIQSIIEDGTMDKLKIKWNLN